MNESSPNRTFPLHGRRLAALALVAAVGVGLVDAAQAGRKKEPESVVLPPTTVFLRSAYDLDPSVYLGRFIKAGTPTDQIDENSTFITECSKFVQPRTVKAGEVLYDEYFNASAAAKVSAGIQKIAQISVGSSSESTMRTKYTLHEKMQGVIEDPAGFNACCKQGPDMCSDRYVGEFLKASGATYIGAKRKRGLEAKTEPGVPIPNLDVNIFPKLEVDDQKVWYRGVTFTQPVYFAFKTSEVNLLPSFPACGEWISVLPKSSLGQYFVGISPNADGEATGRKVAMNNAREQAVKFLGEQISTGSVRVDELSGGGAAIANSITGEGQVERAASGLARYVKDEAWCVQPVSNAQGNFTAVKVLAFLPKTSISENATAAAQAAKAK